MSRILVGLAKNENITTANKLGAVIGAEFALMFSILCNVSTAVAV
jgi:hypothetical protein